MGIILKYQSGKPSSNRIYLLSSRSQLLRSGIGATARKWFNSRFNLSDTEILNENGKVTVVCRTAQKPGNDAMEKIRRQGAEVYDALKGMTDSVMVTGEHSAAVESFVEGMLLAAYRFEKYLTKKERIQLKIIFVTEKSFPVNRMNIIVQALNWARDLVNEPVSYLNAVKLADVVAQECNPAGIRTEIFHKPKIVSLKMGGLLAVNKGSVDPPTFTTLEWKPKGALNIKPIVLIGKGIVFDTGGLSLKPTKNSMDLMKCDMAGAAAVAAVTLAVARLKIPVYLVTLIPATDNRPGGNAYAPGDIITMFNGTTVEIKNTDAEGRMALADALSYAQKFEPELVIDLATLTGSAAAALGVWASAVMGTAHQRDFDNLIESGLSTGDRAVQFPFWEEYEDSIKSPIADLANLGGPEAGMITAGKFLAHFTSSPFIHIDIAGPAFTTEKVNYRGLGATGAGIRLLLDFIQKRVR